MMVIKILISMNMAFSQNWGTYFGGPFKGILKRGTPILGNAHIVTGHYWLRGPLNCHRTRFTGRLVLLCDSSSHKGRFASLPCATNRTGIMMALHHAPDRQMSMAMNNRTNGGSG